MPESSATGSAAAPFERFSGANHHGEVACAFRPADLEAGVSRLVDPASSTGTIHWGRNYIYAAELHTPGGSMPVVVKQFKNQGWKKRLDRRFRGSKAERSWRVAKELLRFGLATPAPVLWVESNEPEGPSFFIAEMLQDAMEIRQFFRRLNGDPHALEFPQVDDLQFLARLGRLARRINDAGIIYRDLSMGNVLAVTANGDLELYLVDFNRARTGCMPGVIRRTRDICRLPVIETSHRSAFLGGYWGTPPSRLSFRWWFYALSVNGFIFKHAVKNRLKFLRFRRRHAHSGSHHPHIPAAAAGASVRDKAVWDHLSDQPHQHASRGEKLMIRIADSPAHLRDLGIVVASSPTVWQRYRKLKRELYDGPRPFTGIGLAVRPWSQGPDRQLAALADLGVGPVLLRLHSWDDDHVDEERLAAALAAEGHDVGFVIAQNRAMVRDRARWRDAVAELSERFLPYGRQFQIGQAINRSKWGIWTHGEYVDLYLEAAEIVRRHDCVELLGPPVIDFEFQALVALLNRRKPDLYFDIVSSLLYVDRRGAPENRQMGLDTVDKVTLLRAIAEVGRNSSSRCWITEFNWPLWEGPHSPAGKTVSVGEEEQADYLVRYYLLTLGTGCVERVYWWRLIARGYGLVAPASDGTLRRRPSWSALRTLVENVEGAVFNGPLRGPAGAFLYAFARDGVETIVGWSVERGARAELPRPAREIISRDGRPVPASDGVRVELGPSPAYFRLR